MKYFSLKICLSCYRYFSNRKKWENSFDDVKYCSLKCKKRRQKLFYSQRYTQCKVILDRSFKGYLSFQDVFQNNSISSIVDQHCIIRKLYIENSIDVYDQKNNKISPLKNKGPYFIKKRKFQYESMYT